MTLTVFDAYKINVKGPADLAIPPAQTVILEPVTCTDTQPGPDHATLPERSENFLMFDKFS